MATLQLAELHLWCADLDEPGGELASDELLDESERQRAAAIADPVMRARFRRSRQWLRRILATYTHDPPAALRFDIGPHGKPALHAQSPQGPDVHFNVSHSRSAWVLAVAKVDPLGVDLELPREVPNAARLSERVFTAEERAALTAASAESAAQRDAVFITCWTRKEAALKALGDGFSLGAASLHVGTVADEVLRSHPKYPARAFRLSMFELPWPGQGACAHAPEVQRIECRWLTG